MHPEKILLFHSGALGDLVNTLPAISALKKKFPESTLSAVGHLSLLELIKQAGIISHAISFETSGFHFLFGEEALPEKVKAFLYQYDLMVSLVKSYGPKSIIGSVYLALISINIYLPAWIISFAHKKYFRPV